MYFTNRRNVLSKIRNLWLDCLALVPSGYMEQLVRGCQIECRHNLVQKSLILFLVMPYYQTASEFGKKCLYRISWCCFLFCDTFRRTTLLWPLSWTQPVRGVRALTGTRVWPTPILAVCPLFLLFLTVTIPLPLFYFSLDLHILLFHDTEIEFAF